MIRSTLVVLGALAAAPVLAELQVLPGSSPQAGIPHQALAPVRFRVLDAGVPLPGARVAFMAPAISVSYGGLGSLDGSECQPRDLYALCAATTGADGIAQFTTLGSYYAGQYTAQVEATHPDGRSLGTVELQFSIRWPAGALDATLTNMWWSGPSETGWGMSLVKHGDQQFNVLFVYDDTGRPTWYVQPGGTWTYGVGSRFFGPVYSPRSSPWHAYDPYLFQAGVGVGDLSLLFIDRDRLFLSLDTGSRHGSAYMEVQDFSAGAPAPLQGVADMWWGGNAQYGWGVAILEQQGNLFLVWFTYGDDGRPTWFVMPGGQWTDARTYSGSIYRTTASKWFEHAYDASQLRIAATGSYAIRFDAPGGARLSYDIDGHAGELALQRQAFQLRSAM